MADRTNAVAGSGRTNHGCDARSRFWEIFDELNRDHGQGFPTWRPTSDALHPPPGATRRGRPTAGPGAARLPLRLLLVPGFGASLLGGLGRPLSDAADHVRRLGFSVDLLEVGTLSGSRRNARRLGAMIARLQHDPDERVVVLGYSKGAVDALVALALHPALSERIAAVVSLAGSIGGSVLAEDLSHAMAERSRWLRRWLPLGGLESLARRRRRAWLETATLPDRVRLYSVVSHARRGRISGLLRPSYERLRLIDPRNDGQVLASDQIVPGSTLLAELNADHWAAALPLVQRHPWLRRLGRGANDYPREIMLEAVLKQIEEDLLGTPGPGEA